MMKSMADFLREQSEALGLVKKTPDGKGSNKEVTIIKGTSLGCTTYIDPKDRVPLKDLLDGGYISQENYDRWRADIKKKVGLWLKK